MINVVNSSLLIISQKVLIIIGEKGIGSSFKYIGRIKEMPINTDFLKTRE
jgi:hypothetical protein